MFLSIGQIERVNSKYMDYRNNVETRIYIFNECARQNDLHLPLNTIPPLDRSEEL